MSKRFTCLLLSSLLLTSVSCGTSAPSSETTADTSSEVTAVETHTPYDSPDIVHPNYNGDEIRILNFDQLWDMYIHIDVDDQNGESLNDAVYNRNRAIEDKLNCKIKELRLTNTSNRPADLTDAAVKTILAGEDTYDAMYLPITANSALITDNYLYDLTTVSAFDFDNEWWDGFINDKLTIDNQLYGASGAAQLMAYDSMWCLFFNENKMTDLALDMPYQLVRDGKWTIDRLAEYAKAGASLNGDDSFAYVPTGKCEWGISAHPNVPQVMWFASGVMSTTTDKNGNILFNYGSEKFYNVADKLAMLLNGDAGMTLKASTTDFDVEKGGYCHVFNSGRSLFLTAEIKTAQLLRDMNDTFGIVPMPKYDEQQDNYYSYVNNFLFFMTIPVTNVAKLEETATVLDYINCYSYYDVTPVYSSQTVEQKGLRNEDSIEMLGIMRDGRSIDIGCVFGWESSLRATLNSKLFTGTSDVASDIAAEETSVKTNIQKFIEAYQK